MRNETDLATLTALYIFENDVVNIIKGSKFGMGYRCIPHDQQFASQKIMTCKNMVFSLVSDGIVDQVGADTGWSVGRSRDGAFAAY